jgi:BMFP domain-containing protein YqiC
MSNQRIFSDLAELAGGAVGVLSSLKQQLRDEARERVDEFAGRLDLVTRADIDRLEGMMAKLRVRLDTLEEKMGTGPKRATPAPKKSMPKSSAKKPMSSSKPKRKK